MYQSDLVNGQLVAVYPEYQVLPPLAPYASDLGAGAGPASLPIDSIGGSSADYLGEDAGETEEQAAASGKAAAGAAQRLLHPGAFGVPSAIIWLVVALVLGYFLLAKVHFSESGGVSAG